ncbi:uncharacterized protein LOC135078750 [Ostrinia nubilalis]|uniref:uncharacterized protein LOC135078750 n=1 Tax=Ostrinia nubilalis TaxID=29057 RepID=UPI0030825EE2
MDSIYLSDESSDSDIVEIKESSDEVVFVNEAESYDQIMKDCRLLGEFIEKCLDIEHSERMNRVIKKSLIPAYYGSSDVFKRSPMLNKLVTRAICKIESDPNFKFFYIKELCCEMSKNSTKLYRKMVRDRTNAKDCIRKRKKKMAKLKQNMATAPPKKKNKLNETENIVVSDDSDGFDVPIINLDELPSQHITDVSSKCDETISKPDVFIEIDIDDVNTLAGTTDAVDVKESISFGPDLQKQNSNINNDDLQEVFSNQNEPELLQNNNNNRTIEEPVPNINATDLENNEPVSQTEVNTRLANSPVVSSQEISSTVSCEDDYNALDKGAKDNELIALDRNEDVLVTTTQEVDENVARESPKVESSSTAVCGNEITNISIVSESHKNVDCSEDNDVVILDEDDTCKLISTHKTLESNSEKEPNVAPASGKGNDSKSSKKLQNNDFMLLGEYDYRELANCEEVIIENKIQIPINDTASIDNENKCEEPAQVLDDAKKREKLQKSNDIIVLDDNANESDEPLRNSDLVLNDNANKKEEPLQNNNILVGNASKRTVPLETNDLIILDDDETCNVPAQKTIKDKFKENVARALVNSASAKNTSKTKEPIQDCDLIVLDDDDDDEKLDSNNVSDLTNEDSFLVPHKAEIFEGPTEEKLMATIKEIENEISLYKRHVARLEQQEVEADTMWSPYIQCESYKAKIVNLYKKLCKLTGEPAVKRREVRLKPANSRSQLCVEKLEELINDNIGDDGLPHFPDFQDVLSCVKEANNEGSLGFNRNEVLIEANALFTCCGRALQESRKRREWRDMLHLVKTEAIADPADSDPELMARLQANRQAAVKREQDLIDRYCEMSYGLPSKECTKENDCINTDDSDAEAANDVTAIKDNTTRNNSSQINNNNMNRVHEIKFTVNNKPNNSEIDSISVVYGSHAKRRITPITLETSDVVRRKSTINKPNVTSNEVDPYNISNHDFTLETKVVLSKLDLHFENDVVKPTISGSSLDKENSRSEEKRETDGDNGLLVKEIKKEPCVDIQEELDMLGNDFTTTILSVEDPFLVVEISSDSEDEDDELTNNASFL